MFDLKNIISNATDLMGDKKEGGSKLENSLANDLKKLMNLSKVADKAEAGENVDAEKTGSEANDLVKFVVDKVKTLNDEEAGKGDSFLKDFFAKNAGNLDAIKKVYDFISSNGSGNMLENLGGLKKIIDGDFSFDTLKKFIKW